MDKFEARTYDSMDVNLTIKVVKFDKYQVGVKPWETNEWWVVWVEESNRIVEPLKDSLKHYVSSL